MRRIAAFSVKQHDTEVREQKVCATCKRRRLTTRCTLTNVGTGQRLIRWFCNECLIGSGVSHAP